MAKSCCAVARGSPSFLRRADLSVPFADNVLSVDFLYHLFSSLSESFFMVKGAALFLQQGSSSQGQRSLQHPHKHAGSGLNYLLKFFSPLALLLIPSRRMARLGGRTAPLLATVGLVQPAE